jgi:glycosyltransferase involved in cell wall biosynthesis
MSISSTQPVREAESPASLEAEPIAVPAGETVFGFVLLGGALSGALIRDMRLANELADRGWPVHVWWVMDRPWASPLRSDISQHWLFHALRYAGRHGSDVADAAGRLLSRIYRDKKRLRTVQKRPQLLERMMQGLVRRVCDSVEQDRRPIRRFAEELSEAGVTHLLPMLAILCPWAAAARDHVRHRLRYLITFQGYELYVNYARAIGREQQLYDRLREAARDSDWLAVAVSEDYLQRVSEDVGVPAESMRAIPPGIPGEFPCDRAGAPDLIALAFPEFRRDVPLVTFIGRRDTEKGIDLLLYAVSILRSRGVKLQLAICGPTLFGDHYSRVCRQLAEDLLYRLPLHPS